MTDTPVQVGEVLRLFDRGELMIARVRDTGTDGLVLATFGAGCFAMTWAQMAARFEVSRMPRRIVG